MTDPDGLDTELLFSEAEIGNVAPGPAKRPPEPPADLEKAPNGWTYRDGRWQPKKQSGRPRVTPRVDDPPTAEKTPGKVAAPKPAKKKTNYREIIAGTLSSVTFVAGIVPIPDQMFGRKLDDIRVKTRVQAGVIQGNLTPLATALNTIAEHNDWLSSNLDKIAEGKGALWALPVVSMVMEFVSQSVELWRAPVDDDLRNAATMVEEQAKETLLKAMGATVALGVVEAAEQMAEPLG